MELYEEFLLTAVVSILLALLIGKLAALGGAERDLGRHAPAEAAAIGGGGEAFVRERRESVGESGGLGVEKAGFGGEAVLGSEGMEASEAEEEGERLERERSLEVILKETEEVRTGEFDQEMGNIAEETIGQEEIEKTVAELVEEDRGFPKDEVSVEKVVQLDEVEEVMGEEKRTEEEGASLFCGEDDWEGIEKTELEKLYGAAAAYIDSEDGKEAMSSLNSDVQMQLYALQKVATEGPCYEPQPMALKVAARSKWYC